MATAATTTPSEPSASPARCQNAARMLSELPLRERYQALRPLTAMPSRPTTSIGPASTSWGSPRRPTASTTTQPVMASSTAELSSAASTSARP